MVVNSSCVGFFANKLLVCLNSASKSSFRNPTAFCSFCLLKLLSSLVWLLMRVAVFEILGNTFHQVYSFLSIEVFGNEPFWLPCQNLIHFMENNSKPVLSVTELSLLEMVPGVSSSAEISWHILALVLFANFYHYLPMFICLLFSAQICARGQLFIA